MRSRECKNLNASGERICKCCATEGQHRAPDPQGKPRDTRGSSEPSRKPKKKASEAYGDPYLLMHGLSPLHKLQHLRLRRNNRSDDRSNGPHNIHQEMSGHNCVSRGAIKSVKYQADGRRIGNDAMSARRRRRGRHRPSPEDAMLYFTRSTRRLLKASQWDLEVVKRACDHIPAPCPIEFEREASSLVQASLSELPWQAVLCPQAIEDTEGRRLMDALKAEEEVRRKWRDNESRLATLSSSLQIKQVTWLGVEERRETVALEEVVRSRYELFRQAQAEWREKMHAEHAQHFAMFEEAIATRVLELEEQQSARWWREEEGLLSVRDTEQRTRHLQHLLKDVEESTRRRRNELWARLRREEVVFWLMVHAALSQHECGLRRELYRIAAVQTAQWMADAKRLREKEAAVLSSCTTEIRRLVAHGARELWRIRNWKDTQMRALSRSEECVRSAVLPAISIEYEDPRRDVNPHDLHAIEQRAGRRYRKRARELEAAIDALDDQQPAFIHNMLQENHEWYLRCVSEFERRMRIEARHRDDVHVTVQAMVGRISRDEKTSFHQRMQASVSEARSRFSYHVLARLMYLDQHYVVQVNKWEGMRHRYQRENQAEAQRIRLAWDGFAQESSKRLQQELIQFVSGGKEGESVWHRSQQGILTDCLDEESDLQCRVVDVFRGLKEGMEADLDQATQRLGLPEHAAHAHTERDALVCRWREGLSSCVAQLRDQWEAVATRTLQRLDAALPVLLDVLGALREAMPRSVEKELERLSAFSAEEASRRRQFSETTRSGFLAVMRDLAASESSVLRREVRLEMHMQEPPEGEDGAEFFRPPLLQATALEQDDEGQRGLAMSYARLTHKRAERLGWLYSRRAELLMATFARQAHVREDTAARREKAVQEAVVEWGRSSSVTIDVLRERLLQEHDTFMSGLRDQLRLKVELEAEDLRVMEGRLLASATTYLALATQAGVDCFSEVEQMRFGFERHGEHVVESYGAALREHDADQALLQAMQQRHTANLVDLSEYVAKQRQGWSATLRTIAGDLAQRLDGYVSAHATQVADAARIALPAIRELQATLARSGGARKAETQDEKAEGTGVEAGEGAAPLEQEARRQQERRLGDYLSALEVGLRKLTDSQRGAVAKALAEAEDRSERLSLRVEGKDAPALLKLGAAKVQQHMEMQQTQLEEAYHRRRQELKSADASLVQKVTTFGDAVGRSNRRAHNTRDTDLKKTAQEQEALLASFLQDAAARIEHMTAVSIKPRHLPPGWDVDRLLRLLEAHFHARHALLTSLGQRAEGHVRRLLRGLEARVGPIAERLKFSERRAAAGLMAAAVLRWAATQVTQRHLLEVVLLGELEGRCREEVETGRVGVRDGRQSLSLQVAQMGTRTVDTLEANMQEIMARCRDGTVDL